MAYSRIETYEMIVEMWKTNKELDQENRRYPYISGPPGIGKSSLVKAFAKSNSLNLCHISLATFEYYELKGLLHPSDNYVKVLPLEHFANPFDVIFFDELNAADISVQKALLEILSEKKVSGNDIKANFFVCAGNPPEFSSAMYDLIEPLEDRLIEIKMRLTYDDALVYLSTLSEPLYKAMAQMKRKLLAILASNDPVSFRRLTSSAKILEKFLETKKDVYRRLLHCYLTRDLAEEIIVCSSMELPDKKGFKAIEIYRLAVTNQLHLADTDIDDDTAALVLLYCNASGNTEAARRFLEWRSKISS